ncbi:MAG: RdgB/HAM1 family non-canonical purine NTP pyrophosphatase [Treponema sp.]|nr:RdgB/HAM1 family non-canonical purine NTP pyrophosphatase [Treponema sp.]
MDIWFATNNKHKKIELEAILNTKLKIPSEEGINFDPEETAHTFSENALIKARELKKLLSNSDDIVIADDSGLCVDALDGRPGVYSARYGELNGKKPSNEEQHTLLLDELGDNPLRSARFVCAMVLLHDHNRFTVVQEITEGQIVKKSEKRGEGGFGYDPIFLFPKRGLTLAELSSEEKNAISHRGKAGRQIAELLRKTIIE